MGDAVTSTWHSMVHFLRVDDLLRRMYLSYMDNPLHIVIQTALIVFIVFLLFQKSYNPNHPKVELTEKEVDQLIDDWKPASLVPADDDHRNRLAEPDAVLEGQPGVRVKVVGSSEPLLNFASLNFLSLVGDERIQTRAIDTVRKYGCGACGPRGFYGTIDVHLDLEKQLAEFMNAEAAILYGSGFNAMASAIPAFCKRGDLIIADENVNFSIQSGLLLSRSTVQYFRHNDMRHLEELLKAATAGDSKRKQPLPRRFIVAEGVYYSTGEVAPLAKMIELKRRYCFRLCLDESLSIGVLGRSGRGLTEEIGMSTSDVEVLVASLGHAFGSVAGFCCGSHTVADHQRLSGAAYCFSAAVPPFLATSASEAVGIVQREPALAAACRANAKLLNEALSAIPEGRVVSAALAPVQHVMFANPRLNTIENVSRVAALAKQAGLLVSTPKYVPQEYRTPPPTIRLAVQAKHSPSDIREAAQILRNCFSKAVSTL